jgi:RNA polymerase sigma-70 factor (ECF subfamily)
MNTTSLSLLDRLKHARADPSQWLEFEKLYLPLIHKWLSGVRDLRDDADDLAQEVLVILVRELPSFERQRHGSFRAWLRQITVNRIRNCWKAKQKRPLAGLGDDLDHLLSQLEDPKSDLSRQWDREHDKHVFQQLLTVVKPNFETTTWAAFTRFALDGMPAAKVAKELGITANNVMQAKSRVLKRLREVAGELID